MLVALVPPWLKLAGELGGEVSPPVGAVGQGLVLPAMLTTEDLVPLELKASTPTSYVAPQRRVVSVYAVF